MNAVEYFLQKCSVVEVESSIKWKSNKMLIYIKAGLNPSWPLVLPIIAENKVKLVGDRKKGAALDALYIFFLH